MVEKKNQVVCYIPYVTFVRRIAKCVIAIIRLIPGEWEIVFPDFFRQSPYPHKRVPFVITVVPGSTVRDVEKAFRRGARDRREDFQSYLTYLMRLLPLLNFGDSSLLVDWMSDFIEVEPECNKKSFRHIIKVFARHGFVPGMNSGTAFNGEDRENYAGWLIGYALAAISDSRRFSDLGGRPLPQRGYKSHVAEWRRKFNLLSRVADQERIVVPT